MSRGGVRRMTIAFGCLRCFRELRGRGNVGDFKKLQVWSEAECLVEKMYRATAGFPDRERYGLISQMRRAAYSVCANIAEGCGRLGDRELARFSRIAAGSATELEALIILAERLRYLEPNA